MWWLRAPPPAGCLNISVETSSLLAVYGTCKAAFTFADVERDVEKKKKNAAVLCVTFLLFGLSPVYPRLMHPGCVTFLLSVCPPSPPAGGPRGG